MATVVDGGERYARGDACFASSVDSAVHARIHRRDRRLGLSLVAFATPASATTFTVTTAADNGDNTTPSAGSLREAIILANSNDGPDTIEFAIGSAGTRHAITPLLQLPAISESVLIDGKSQGGPSYTGVPLVELDGSSAGAAFGVTISADDVELRGLIVNRFALAGIFINGARGKVTGSYVGTNAAGTMAAANGFQGISVLGPEAIIGGIGIGEGNVISGNSVESINVFCPCSSATIVGNYIGTNAAGTSAVANGGSGVQILGSPNVTVGGPTLGHRNVISGNGQSGVYVQGSPATNAKIHGNDIGTDKDGLNRTATS
jgi:CSLREA domain-containing protein